MAASLAREKRSGEGAEFLLIVLEGTVMFGELDLVLQERTISSAWSGTCETNMTLETEQRTASTSSHSSEASTFNGDALFGSERAYRKFVSTRTGCLHTIFADIGADSPPRSDCSETRMVETESAGDHFSLRMSAVESSLSVSVRTEAHRGGRASSWENLGKGTGHTEADGRRWGLSRAGMAESAPLAPQTADTIPSSERTVAGGFKSDGRGLVWVLGREPQRDRVSVTFIDGAL